MSDNIALSSPPSRSWRRERSLRATRQRLKRLEIETHRIKAELARLESENETELADELAQELKFEGAATNASDVEWSKTTRRWATTPRGDVPLARPARQAVPVAHLIAVPPKAASNGRAACSRLTRPRRKKLSRAWLASIGIHALVLLLLAPMTYVILTNEHPPLFASMFAAEPADLDDLGTAPIELVSFEEAEMPSDAAVEATSLAESVAEEFGAVDAQPRGETAPNLGQLSALPTDVGTLMAGGGGSHENRPSGGGGRGAANDEARLGRTSFFGTPARANRVVFLVDNSASMKQGRMETTLFELARSVEQLGEKQEFYVVFYSDQAYPMFYPQSVMEPLRATRENKQRLFRWLQTVELCIGGKLLDAVKLADSLEPEVVYLLSDGDIAGNKTMEQLTQLNNRRFSIHTLGMGVKKPQDAQNLALIAQANRGTFQMVGTLPAAVQMAKAHPIRSNPFSVSWGQGSLVPGR
jgi:hypothetical protein